MKSKVHPRYKTKYRVANWAAYNRALVRRGDVTVWVSSEAVAAWTPRRSGRRGGQRRYSNLAIETALTLRLLYHLPAAPSRRIPARPVRDDAPRPLRPRLYDVLQAQSASEAPSAAGSRPARASISCSTARVCPSSGPVSGLPRNTVAAAGVAGGSSTLASISQA